MPGITGFRLDEEQRARVCDCLLQADLRLPEAALGRLVRDIESSISRFLTIAPSATPPARRTMRCERSGFWRMRTTRRSACYEHLSRRCRTQLSNTSIAVS